MCLCNIRLLLSNSISCVRGRNLLIATETHLVDNMMAIILKPISADLSSLLRTTKDGILDGNITSYLLLNIVSVYASGCKNSTRYNLLGVIQDNRYIFCEGYKGESFLLEEIIHTISRPVSNKFCRTFWNYSTKKSLNIELKYKSPN